MVLKKILSVVALIAMVSVGAVDSLEKNPALIELLAYMQVAHDGTLPSIVQATQRAWLRPAGVERWQLEELPESDKKEVLRLAQQLGFINAVKPAQQQYDYCLILGATTGSMRIRLNTVVALWQQGVRYNQIFLLVGDRPLDKSVEPEAERWQTESEAMRHLWEEQEMPAALREIPCTLITAPMIKDATGKFRRPTTKDTIDAFLAKNPVAGSCCCISNQPAVLYQQAVIRALLPDSWSVETIGAATSLAQQKAATVLDMIARCLYASLHRR